MKGDNVKTSPIFPKGINPKWGTPLYTYEVECVSCHELKWPSLPAKPKSYTCARCLGGVGSTKRGARRVAGRAKEGPRIARQTTREAND